MVYAELIAALAAAGLSPIASGPQARSFSSLQYDSRRVSPGTLFVALVGAAADGHRFVSSAVASGASGVLVEREFDDASVPPEVVVVRVDNTRQALAHAASAFYGHPSRRLEVVGITGTNAKTTTTYLLEAMAQACGRTPGVIGTINIRFGDTIYETKNTTPESLDLQRILDLMARSGVDIVFMEVSSHALTTWRVEGVSWSGAMFTNFSQDHLDFHGTMEAYFAAKARLFRELLPASAAWSGRAPVAVLNANDARIAALGDGLGDGVRVLTYGTGDGEADFEVVSRGLDVRGMSATVRTPSGDVSIASRLVGGLNLENVVGALALALSVGMDAALATEGLVSLSGVPGRLERVGRPDRGPSVFVDYAHTPDAVGRAIASLREVTTGRLVVVLGCGGDRDASKRAPMGWAAAAADLVVATSDNPRGEDPEKILDALVGGLVERGAEALVRSGAEPGGGRARYVRCADRRRAIALACGLATVEDTVMIAGKGHEDYQEIRGIRTPLSDRVEGESAVADPSGRRVVELLDVGELARAASAELEGEAPLAWHGHNTGVYTDSRRVGPGGVFVALAGERFDGHDFLDAVIAQGALAVVVEGESGRARAREAWGRARRPGVTLTVPDTVYALGELGRRVLEEARRWRPDFVTLGLTGSNGKTTTKELIAALLVEVAGLEPSQVHRTPGNYNNFIGLPLTLFELRYGHRVAVLELGTNAFGEIARLVSICSPEVRALVSIGRAHLEGLESEEGVLRAKAEILSGAEGSDVVLPLKWLDRVEAGGWLVGRRLGVFGPESEAPPWSTLVGENLK